MYKQTHRSDGLKDTYIQELVEAMDSRSEIPTEREDCTCCLLPSGKIFVAGGRDKDGRTSRVDVATVLN